MAKLVTEASRAARNVFYALHRRERVREVIEEWAKASGAAPDLFSQEKALREVELRATMAGIVSSNLRRLHTGFRHFSDRISEQDRLERRLAQKTPCQHCGRDLAVIQSVGMRFPVLVCHPCGYIRNPPICTVQ